jgi:uncharacterized protein (DUF885 family)
MKYLLCSLFLVLSFCVKGQTTSDRLNQSFDTIDSIYKAYEIKNPIYSGEHPEVYAFQTTEQLIERNEKLKTHRQELVTLLSKELNQQEQINASIRLLQLDNDLTYTDFKMYLLPFNAEGGFFNTPLFFLKNLPFNALKDYNDYLQWLPSFVEYLYYNKGLMETGIKTGITAPKIIANNLNELLEPWSNSELEKHPLYRPFLNFDQNIVGDNEPRKLLEEANQLFREQIIPAYQNLQKFVVEDYYKAAKNEPGISEVKGGKAYYENRIRYYSTLDMTPDEVYNTGLEEVSRIRAEMDKIISELGFDGTYADFLNFLRTDPQFYATTPQELLNLAAWLSKKAEGQLPKFFSELYELPFTVEPVPAEIAPTYTAGRYVGGNRDQNKAGIYWVNTHDLKSRSLYTLPALTLHEAVPGHHLQTTIARELENLPSFRKGSYISAFGEGWGLYAEFLGEEMGMYETPYDLFGRYTYEMWRACRLVIDVGLHYKGWSREKALTYMSENTALSLHEVKTEIDRYIGWPGQAVSYKIGEIHIRALRNKAEESLGSNFDIQKFHQVVLTNGAVPLSMLTVLVDSYIQETLNAE